MVDIWCLFNWSKPWTVIFQILWSSENWQGHRAQSLLAATAAQPCHCPRWWWGWPSSVSTIIRCCCVSTSLQPWQGYSPYKLSTKFLSSRLFISGNKITLSPSAWSWSTHLTAHHTPLASSRRGQWTWKLIPSLPTSRVSAQNCPTSSWFDWWLWSGKKIIGIQIILKMTF